MKSIVFAAALLAAPLTHAAEFASVVPEKSSIAFVTKQMGVAVDGSFKRFKATLAFDPAKPQSATAQFDIDTASIDAGGAEANDEAKGKNWFAVQQYPTASFKATSVKALGPNKFEVHGPLTIRGKSKEVVAPVSFKQDGANGVFDGALTIKRLEFGLGQGMWADTDTVGDEVQIKFHIVAAPKK